MPAPTKYSKVITWAVPDAMNSEGILKAKRITLFDQLSRSSKGQPGPATYKKEKSIDKFSCERTKGTYKSGEHKFTYLEALCHEKRKDPGPQHKYKINHDSYRPKTPFYVNFAKSQERFNLDEKPKKKSVGPASYNTDSAVLKLSSYKKTTINIPISGIGVVFGSKPITH